MKLKKEGSVLRITLLGLSLALYFVLSFTTANFQFVKISLAGLPIIFIAVIYGPFEAAGLGFLGEFIMQMITYGFTPTTILWCLPAVARGLIVGFMFKQKDIRTHKLLWILTITVSCIVVTLINTFVIFVDAKIFEYPSQLTTITIFIRLANSIASAVAYALLLPALIIPLINQGKFETD